mgnify:CR=1 FL=1
MILDKLQDELSQWDLDGELILNGLNYLKTYGYLCEEKAESLIDIIESVRKFQVAFGLKDDGLVVVALMLQWLLLKRLTSGNHTT